MNPWLLLLIPVLIVFGRWASLFVAWWIDLADGLYEPEPDKEDDE